jgi:hypothetical protein
VVGHQPDRADELLAVQDPDGKLTPGGGIPGRQRRPPVVQRVGSRDAD